MQQIATTHPFRGYTETRQGGRSENQDYVKAEDTPYGLLVVVCDGMGGGPGGRTASSAATETIFHYLQNPSSAETDRKEVLKQAIKSANALLLNLQEQNPQLRGMGTTVTAILINRHSVVLSHVGDSRIYQFRFGRKIFRTRDDSLVADMVSQGLLTEEEARTSSNSNVITRALGIKPLIEPFTEERAYEKGDRFVLCTDGVWGTMPEKVLIQHLARTKKLSGAIEQTMVSVEQIGQESGASYDNFSMAIVEPKHNSKIHEPMTHKVKNLLISLAIICLVSLITNVVLATSRKQPPAVAAPVVKDNGGNSKVKLEEVDFYRSKVSDLQSTIDSLQRKLEMTESSLGKFSPKKGGEPSNKKDLASEVNSVAESTNSAAVPSPAPALSKPKAPLLPVRTIPCFFYATKSLMCSQNIQSWMTGAQMQQKRQRSRSLMKRLRLPKSWWTNYIKNYRTPTRKNWLNKWVR